MGTRGEMMKLLTTKKKSLKARALKIKRQDRKSFSTEVDLERDVIKYVHVRCHAGS